MEISHIFAVTALFAGLAESFFDPSIPGYGALNLHRVMSMLTDSSKGFYNSNANRGTNELHHYDSTRNRAADGGSDYKGHASQVGHQNDRSSSNGYGNRKNADKYGHMHDDAIRQINRLSKNLGHRSSANNVHNRRDENSANGFNAGAANKKAYQTGKVFGDNMVYSFDKVYDQNMTERGGFENEEGRNAHRLNAFTDKKKADKHIKGKHTAQNARQDVQKAQRGSTYTDRAAQRQKVDSKYGTSDKKHDKAGATQDAQEVLYDRNDNRYYAEREGDKKISKDTKNFANKDEGFHRDAAASHVGNQRHGDKKYDGVHGNGGSLGQHVAAASRAGNRGHADKVYQGRHGNDGSQGNHSPSGYSGARPVRKSGTQSGIRHGTGTYGDVNGGRVHHKSNVNRHQTEQDKKHLGKNSGASDIGIKSYNQAKKKGDFARVKGFRDQREGKFAQAVHNAQNAGYNNQESHSGKGAQGKDRKSAKADAGSGSKAAVHDFDGKAFDKELYQKNQQDNSENYKKRKNFYHDKNQDGKNYERLNYKRKSNENEYAESQAANNQHKNQFSKDHKSAGHNARNRNDHFLNAKKASNKYGRLKADRKSDGHSDNRGTTYAKRNQHSLGNNKEISESDFTKDRDALAKNRRDHRDDSHGTAAKSASGFQNKESRKKGYNNRQNGNGIHLDRSLLTRPDFGSENPLSYGTASLQNMFKPINFVQKKFRSLGPVSSGNFGSFNQRHNQGQYGRTNAGRSLPRLQGTSNGNKYRPSGPRKVQGISNGNKHRPSGPRKVQGTSNGNKYRPSGPRRVQPANRGTNYGPSGPRRVQAPNKGNKYGPSGGNGGHDNSYGGPGFGTNPFGDFNVGGKTPFALFDDAWRSSSGFTPNSFGADPFGKSDSFAGSDSGFGYYP